MAGGNRHFQPALVCALLVGVTFVVYWPVTQHGFINLDDPDYVTRNAHVRRGVTPAGMLWAFTTDHAANWHPLTWLSHMLDVQLFGLKPGPHHLVSLGIHAANALLLFLLLKGMTGALWRSALVAALFALHPLHVESVAWVSERKDVLSTFFGLLAVWTYAAYARKCGVHPAAVSPARGETPNSKTTGVPATHHAPRTTSSPILQPAVSSLQPPAWPYYLLSLLSFALSLMSKPMLVTLPFLLLLFDHWPLNRLQLNTQQATRDTPPASTLLLRLVLEKLPYFALSAFSCTVTLIAQRRGGAVGSSEEFPMLERISNAVMAYLSYLGKTFWPHSLTMFYPYRQDWSTGAVLSAGLLLLALSVVALISVRRRPFCAVGWFGFLGTLVPTIGLVQAGTQAMADRYGYLPLVGLFCAVVWGASELLHRWRGRQAILAVLGSIALLACLTATLRQLSHWRSTEALCRHALRVTSGNFLAHSMLGSGLLTQGRHDEARAELATALQIHPDALPALVDMGRLLVKTGKDEEAAAFFERTLAQNPQTSPAHYLLAGILARKGESNDATRHFEAAIAIDPDCLDTRNDLAAHLIACGKPDVGLTHGLAALRLDPNSPMGHFNAAKALTLLGKPAQAVAHYQAATAVSPDFWEAHLNCAQVLQDLGQHDTAETHLRKVLRLRPDCIEAHRVLAALYSVQNRPREQAREYAELLRLNPEWPEVQNNLAWLLATHSDPQVRNGAQAVPLAERACRLTRGTNLSMLSTLAAAYAEAGRVADAVSTQQKVCDLAIAQGHTAQAESLRQRLEVYRSGHAYHRP
ncbi:MAG TPA: tetratricopeptide repeat protein [Candidatus Paceibacterota bacterium]|nr:tetratricopeptide repeat protein [Verrucomicrobiota bacterium]HSA11920.1 tetratricopeptide repeat protein [Candidatus Paceibacterota bacterium]